MSASSPASTSALAGKFLGAGLAGLALTAVGLFVGDAHGVALSYVVGISYWTAVAIGMLMLVMIHHIFDAGWSTVIRRQFEHGLSAFFWLFILFLPLLVSVWVKPGFVWPWMDLSHPLHGGHGTVGTDILYQKKASFLNPTMFTGMTLAFFAGWIWLSARLRKASFAQDKDGDAKWTFMNRKTAAFGIPINALALSFAAIYWMKSLEYHWFSTMYGVWFFANCMRAALAIGVVITWWLYTRGDYKGIFNTNQLHCLVALAFAFVVFWAYVTFSQYFLIWNANVPEETFWYNIREHGDWLWVGMVLLFGHFFVPFLFWLSYRSKATLKPGAYVTIERLATALKEVPARKVMIEGHTDSVGSDEYNQQLSQNRALSVQAALMERGVQSSQVSTVGKGESTPVASNDDPGGRQQNRRVELIFQEDPARVAAEE